MWTKREFPTERVDKLMENCLGSLPRAYPHVSPFDHIPPQQT
jgi:hypothetical protein